MRKTFFITTLVIYLFIGLNGQQADYRPGLFFREDWTEEPGHLYMPISQEHVDNQNLLIGLYGPGQDSLTWSHHNTPVDDPYYVWSGRCLGNWMVSLQHREKNVDLSGYAKIKWRSKQAGFRQLRITLRLADGTWLVSNAADDSSKDWRVREFILSDFHWYGLDMDKLIETAFVAAPDLSNVKEIGFTDLMRGGRSLACSRLDWIEVYGRAVSR